MPFQNFCLAEELLMFSWQSQHQYTFPLMKTQTLLYIKEIPSSYTVSIAILSLLQQKVQSKQAYVGWRTVGGERLGTLPV